MRVDKSDFLSYGTVRDRLLKAMHAFGFEELISTVGGPPPYGHRKFKQGKLVPIKRLLAKLPSTFSKTAVRDCLGVLQHHGYVGFSGRGRHAGWTLTEEGWKYAESVKAMAATPPTTAITTPKRKRPQ